jgi:hypothetical protein
LAFGLWPSCRYMEQRHGPTSVIVQSPMRTAALVAMVPSLDEMPIIRAPANTKDSSYPALDWQRYAVRRMLQQFSMLEHWLSNQILTARFKQKTGRKKEKKEKEKSEQLENKRQE